MSADSFKKINFGYISAENEQTESEDLILKGQLDYNNSVEEALDGNKWLFLGYKGTGKSSLAVRLDLENKNKYDKFIKIVTLGNFPFKSFRDIIPGKEAKETTFPIAWSWILLVYIFESLYKDKGVKHPEIEKIEKIIKAFRKLGFSEYANIATIIGQSSKKNFSVSLNASLALIGGIGGSYAESGSEPIRKISDYVPALKEFIASFKSDSKHYLVIDGLDDILTGKDIQYQSLAALLQESHSLNQYFRSYKLPIKIILLCRRDVFDKLSYPNKNKLRDYSFEFNWYHDPRHPNESLLIQVAELRTRLALGDHAQLFRTILPEEVSTRNRSEGTQKRLLDMTRHTPRDFLQLLKHIQKFMQGPRVTDDAILQGERSYSNDYFKGEIQDELSGYIKPDKIDAIIAILGEIRVREFSFSELEEKAQTRFSRDELLEVLNALYDCSAIGNSDRKFGNTFYSRKYEQQATKFNPQQRIIIHKGLWKTLNIG